MPKPPDEDSVEIELETPIPDETPLPRALPYHVAEPTRSASVHRLEDADLIDDPGATLPTQRVPLDEAEEPDEDAVTPIPATTRTARFDADEVDDDDALPTDAVDALDERSDDEVTAPPRDPSSTTPMPRYTFPDEDDAVHTPPMVLRDDPPPEAVDPFSERRTRTASQAVLAGRFFAPLPADRRGQVLDRFTRRAVKAGATVIRQGESGHPLVLVADGRLEVRAELATGELVVIAALGAGEFVGEAALLARMPAPAHVVALSDAELLLLTPRDLYELAGAFPALWAELKDLAERRTREHDRRTKKR